MEMFFSLYDHSHLVQFWRLIFTRLICTTVPKALWYLQFSELTWCPMIPNTVKSFGDMANFCLAVYDWATNFHTAVHAIICNQNFASKGGNFAFVLILKVTSILEFLWCSLVIFVGLFVFWERGEVWPCSPSQSRIHDPLASAPSSSTICVCHNVSLIDIYFKCVRCKSK